MLIRAILNLRKWASSLVRKYRWAPAAATLLAALGLTITVVKDLHFFWAIGAAVALMFSSYVWGYSARALRGIDWPSLAHLPRRQYGEVWDALATSPRLARAAACGKVERPPYGPRLSTAAELTTYALRAGFEQVKSRRRAPLVIVTAIKPNLAASNLAFHRHKPCIELEGQEHA
jgi:hypothetical protein